MAWIRMGGGASKKEDILYLYKNGDECSDVTNGWSPNGYTLMDNDNTNANGVTKGSDKFVINRQSSKYTSAHMGTNSMVDLTEYSTLVVECSSGTFKVNISNIKEPAYIDMRAWTGNDGTAYTAVLFVSKSKYYVSHPSNSLASVGLGGISTSVYRVWLEKPTYLYKDGKKNVAWDNSGIYSLDGYTSDGGFEESATALIGALPPSTAHTRAIVTDNVIDLSDYKSLKVDYGIGTASLDISTVTNGYVVLSVNQASPAYFRVYVSSTKDKYNTSKIKDFALAITSNVNITRVWLEK